MLGNGPIIGSPFSFNGQEFVRQAYIDASDIEKLATIKSFREPLEQSLNSVIQPAIVKNFAAEGRPAWRPLSESTLISRAMHKTRQGGTKASSGTKILDRTGRLRKAAIQKNIWQIQNDQLTFMVNFFTQKVPYAAFHQLGTRNMVARPFISIIESEENEIGNIFDRWVESRLRRFWGT